MNTELVSKNYNMIDLMRFISSILVISIHTSPVSGEIGFLLNNVVARIAVPFFFTTSGYFLYSKIENNCKYVTSYIKKILYIYIVWYVIYFIFRCFIEFKGLNIKIIILLIREFLFSGYYQLWYLPSLVLSILVVSIFIKKRKFSFLYITSIFLFFLGISGDSYYGFFNNKLLDEILEIYFFIFGSTKTGVCFGVPFITLGVIIKKYDIKIKHLNSMLIVSIILFIGEARFLDFYNIGKGRNIYIMLVFVVALIFIKLLYLRCEININLAKLLKRLSLRIYCSHAFFILLFNEFIEILNYNSYYINLFKFFFVFISSLILSFLFDGIKQAYELKTGSDSISCTIKS